MSEHFDRINTAVSPLIINMMRVTKKLRKIVKTMKKLELMRMCTMRVGTTCRTPRFKLIVLTWQVKLLVNMMKLYKTIRATLLRCQKGA